MSGECFIRRSASERDGLALEVEDDVVVPDAEYLPQVIIPVHPDAAPTHGRGQLLHAAEQLAPAAKHQSRLFNGLVGKARQVVFQVIERPGGPVVKVGRQPRRVFGRNGLRRKRGIAGFGGEGQVKLGGAPT